MTAPESKDDRLAVVVAAAGRSSRMGGTDKTFAQVHGLPLVAHTLRRLAQSDAVNRIALVVADQSVARARRMVDELGIGKVHAVCAGGTRRQDSVYAGLTALGPCRWAAVHDGARPCITDDLLARALDAVRRWDAAVAAVPVKDTIKVVSRDGIITDTPDRSSLWAAQTPQAFNYDRLLAAHRAANAANVDYTDDAAMAEAMGQAVHIFPGSYDNLKVTTPEDLILAGHILADDFRSGDAGKIR